MSGASSGEVLDGTFVLVRRKLGFLGAVGENSSSSLIARVEGLNQEVPVKRIGRLGREVT